MSLFETCGRYLIRNQMTDDIPAHLKDKLTPFAMEDVPEELNNDIRQSMAN